MAPPGFERRVVFLVGAVQFVNILDFTIVMPLGPDFTRALGIPSSNIGYITAAYTVAAAVIGFLGSFFLDRFDRRAALAVCLVGLGAGTAAAGLAGDLPSLLAARLLAGLFGGPATSLAMSIIADVIPRERRGKAMGAVAGALSVAQVVGIPAGLRLALVGGWRLPFFVVGALGAAAALGTVLLLPPMRGHLERAEHDGPAATASAESSLANLLARPVVRLSYLMTALVMGAGFLVVPNLATYVQSNLGWPRAHLEYLYAIGGSATFVTNRLFGRLVDKLGSFTVGTAGVLLAMALMVPLFVAPPPGLPVLPVFVGFMILLGARNVAYNSLTTQVPHPAERARFLSLQSTVYHLASSIGATASARIMWERPDHRLGGMDRVAILSMALMALFPVVLRLVERRLSREAAVGSLAHPPL